MKTLINDIHPKTMNTETPLLCRFSRGHPFHVISRPSLCQSTNHASQMTQILGFTLNDGKEMVPVPFSTREQIQNWQKSTSLRWEPR